MSMDFVSRRDRRSKQQLGQSKQQLGRLLVDYQLIYLDEKKTNYRDAMHCYCFGLTANEKE